MPPNEKSPQEKQQLGAAQCIVDLRADSFSQPTMEMRQAMFKAVVGDDVYNEDPTVNELERKAAELTGKEAALFVASGTMANLVSIMTHCERRRCEAIVGSLSHTYLFEQCGAAQLAGIQLSPIENKPDGTFCLKRFQNMIRGRDFHEAITTMAIVENTHNMCSGAVMPLEWLDEFTRICQEKNLKSHMDGARLFNAAAALGVPVARICRDFDSVAICLSKSLCAPVGSLVAGTKEFIDRARCVRKVLGGGMRQAGFMAAAGIVALDTIVPRLADDHRRMRRIAEAIDNLHSPYVKVDLATVQTNLCILHMGDVDRYPGEWLRDRLARVEPDELNDGIVDANGRPIIVRALTKHSSFLRFVTYHDVDDEQTEDAIKKIVYCIRKMKV